MAMTADISMARQVPNGALQAMRTRLPWPVTLYVLVVVFPLAVDLGPLMMTSLRAFLIVMIIPLTVNLFTGRYGKLYATDYLFVLHILWAAVALAVNNPDKVIEQIGSVGMEFLGGYLVGRAYIRSREDFIALCKFLVLIVCALFPFALVETVTGRPLLLEAIRSIPSVRTVGLNYQEQRLGLERVQMTFAHPIHWGLFCSVAFSLAFVALKGFSSTTWRLVSSAIIGVSGFLALSSGALLAMFLQIGLIGWAIVFANVKQRWWILFWLFVLAYIVIDILSNRTPIHVFLSYATFSSHTAYWRMLIFEWGTANVLGSAEKGISGNPLFGIGLNEWVRPYYMYSGSMDNFWLVMAVRYGLPGFITVTLGYILILYHVMQRNFDADPLLAQIRRAWVFTFLGLSFTLCTVHVWTNIYSFVFFMFGAGVWLISVPTRGRSTTEEIAPAELAPSINARFARSPAAQTPPTHQSASVVRPERNEPVFRRDAPAPKQSLNTSPTRAGRLQRTPATPRFSRTTGKSHE